MKKVILKYIIRKITEDGLVKPANYGYSSWSNTNTEYNFFDSVEDAVKFCEEKEIYSVVILPQIVLTWD